MRRVARLPKVAPQPSSSDAVAMLIGAVTAQAVRDAIGAAMPGVKPKQRAAVQAEAQRYLAEVAPDILKRLVTLPPPPLERRGRQGGQ